MRRCVHPPSAYFISLIHNNKRRCLLCLGKGDVKHTLLSLPETRKWRKVFIIKKWLGIKDEADYKEILRTVNKACVIDLGRHLDTVK